MGETASEGLVRSVTEWTLKWRAAALFNAFRPLQDVLLAVRVTHCDRHLISLPHKKKKLSSTFAKDVATINTKQWAVIRDGNTTHPYATPFPQEHFKRLTGNNQSERTTVRFSNATPN